MPVTLGTARGDLRAQLNEVTPVFFADTDLNNWLNEGCRDVARKAKCLMAKSPITATAGIQSYAAPANLLECHRAEYLPNASTNTYVLEFRNYPEMDAIWGSNQTNQGYYPNFYTLWGEPPNTQLVLYPVPASSGTLNLYYFRTPTVAAADGSNLDTPEGWWDLAIMHAFWKALFKASDPRWKDQRQAYNEEIQFMIAQADRGYSDATGRFSQGSPNMPAWPWGGVEGMWL